MLYIGVFFVGLGSYSIMEEFCDIKYFLKKRELIKKENINIDGFLKVKIMVGLFCIVTGILSIINYFYY